MSAHTTNRRCTCGPDEACSDCPSALERALFQAQEAAKAQCARAEQFEAAHRELAEAHSLLQEETRSWRRVAERLQAELTEEKAAHAELVEIHRITANVAGIVGSAEGDTLTVRRVKQMAAWINQQHAQIQQLEAALAPFARLELPTKPQGNAGMWSLYHEDIRRAQDALAPAETEARELERVQALLSAVKAARAALAHAIKANWPGATDADVAGNVVIKQLDAALSRTEAPQ